MKAGLLAGRQVAGGGGLPFDLAFDALWWASGPAMLAESPTDGSIRETIPDEIGSNGLTGFAGPTAGPTWQAADSEVGGEPSFKFASVGTLFQSGAFASFSQPWSVVLLLQNNSGANDQYFIDGMGGSNRCLFRTASGNWNFFAGSSFNHGATPASGFRAFALVANGASSKIRVAGSQSTGNAGSHSFTGITLGSAYDFGAPMLTGRFVLVGVYNGDVTADGDWAAFQSWVSTTYSLSL